MRADKIKNEPVSWLWKERIPRGMITVIAGRPGGSKSMFAIRLSRDVSKKGTVYLSCAEDSLRHMIGPRLTAAGANRRRIIVPEDDPHFPDDFETFAKKVKLNNIQLAIFDPVNVHLSDGVSRYNDSIRRATNPLKRLCEETGLAVVFVDHVLKNVAKNAHPLTAIGGASSGLSAAARMVYIVGRDPEDKDRILMCNIKSNLRDDPEPFEFAMDEEDVPGFGSMSLLIDTGEAPGYDVMNLLHRSNRGGKLGRPPTKREAALEFLIEYLNAAPNHEARAKDIIEDAKQYGVTKRTLEGAKADADIESDKRGAEWWWSLPQELIDALDASS
jgi:DNA repair protein RadA/Sms